MASSNRKIGNMVFVTGAVAFRKAADAQEKGRFGRKDADDCALKSEEPKPKTAEGVEGKVPAGSK